MRRWSWSGSTRSIISSSAAAARCSATPDVTRMEQAIAALCPGDAPGFRRFLAENRAKMERFRTCLESPFHGWRDVLSPRMLKMLPLLRPWLSLDGELGALLPRPADPAGPDVPVEVSGDVALQLPEPVLDPVVHGVRVRRLPPDRRLRGRLSGDGPGGARSWVSRSGRARRYAKSSSAADAPSASARNAGDYAADALVINADFARAMTRLVPDRSAEAVDRPQDRRQEVLLLDVHDVPRHRGPIRRTWPTTRSTWPRTTAAIWRTSRRGTS